MELSEKSDLTNNSLVKDIIGKDVVNSYGWIIGKVIGFSNDKRDSSLIGIELTNGGFIRLKLSTVEISQDAVVKKSSWKVQVELLANDITSVMNRISALDEIKGEISEKIHGDLLEKFENEKKVLFDQGRILTEKLKDRLKEVEIRLNEVYEFIVNIKINYRLGEINEEIYQNSNLSLQTMIDKLHIEENDVKFALDKLTNNLSNIPPEPLKPLPPSKSEQPLETPIKLRLIEEKTE